MVPERYWRFHSTQAAERVSSLAAGIERGAWMQDWPLEVADGGRLDEFLGLLERREEPDVRFALMDLILCSLDEAPLPEQARVWPRVATILATDPTSFAHHIVYWSCCEEKEPGVWVLDEEPDRQFSITPLMRAVLHAVRHRIGFSELG